MIGIAPPTKVTAEAPFTIVAAGTVTLLLVPDKPLKPLIVTTFEAVRRNVPAARAEADVPANVKSDAAIEDLKLPPASVMVTETLPANRAASPDVTAMVVPEPETAAATVVIEDGDTVTV